MNNLVQKCRRISMIVVCLLLCVSFSACKGSNKKANEYLNQNGYKFTKSSVKTPKGSSVATWKYSSNLTKAHIKECNAYVTKYYPNAKKLREPTIKYNCHSYAWYSTSTSNGHWMNNPSKYWKDKSYRKYASSTGTIPSNVSISSKVVYWDGNSAIHSGIITSKTKVTSKWGMSGLYEHKPKDAPYQQSDGKFKLTFYKK